MAAEAPEALAELRAAVADGRVEVVGASYGQPYGLFHGGESNARQLIYGARAARRLLGVWPKAFWEEEFDFFPQLPQMLRAAGFDNANLFFQWTWHTPEVPLEEAPLILWEGADGTRIPTLAKTALALHQWPEDFDGILERAVRGGGLAPRALVQWLELMPSPDWMCRSELLLPRLKELAADPRFDFQPMTQSQAVAALTSAAGLGGPPVRAYRMDQVWHGMSLGKNGDQKLRQSRQGEAALLRAESLAAVAGLCGRPYASWDVYPAWELEEGWRELLAAQHHDNHECEGLCGAIGDRSFERSFGLAEEVAERTLHALAERMPDPGDEGGVLIFNPLGWERRMGDLLVPPLGWASLGAGSQHGMRRPVVAKESRLWAVGNGVGYVSAVRKSGRIFFVSHGESSEVQFAGEGMNPPQLRVQGTEVPWLFQGPKDEKDAIALTWREAEGDAELVCRLAVDDESDGVVMAWSAERLPFFDPGFGGALELFFPVGRTRAIRADTPYAAQETLPGGKVRRKYPEGDWMTSPQWYETVEGAITAHSFVDLELESGDRLLIAHDGSAQWFARPDGIACVLTLRDPWDERRWEDGFEASFLLIPHAGLSASACWRIAQQFRRPLNLTEILDGGGPAALPESFGALRCTPENVAVTAFHREQKSATAHLQRPFTGGAVRNPYVVRLVELDNQAAEVCLTVAGPVAAAARVNLLGEVIEELHAEPAPAEPNDLPGVQRQSLRFRMRPREIATIMLDLVPGRHQPRNLDQHRAVWATAHKVPQD
jgi:alpha-mannosidase